MTMHITGHRDKASAMMEARALKKKYAHAWIYPMVGTKTDEWVCRAAHTMQAFPPFRTKEQRERVITV